MSSAFIKSLQLVYGIPGSATALEMVNTHEFLSTAKTMAGLFVDEDDGQGEILVAHRSQSKQSDVMAN